MILRISIGGFPLSQPTQDAIEALREDRLLFRSNFDIQVGGVSTALSYLADRTTPNLLIIETDIAKEQIFSQLEQLANVCDPETRLILISPHNDIQLYQELIDSGVSDYLVSPVTSEKIRDAISKAYRGMEAMSDGRIIAFMGMTGGVGSSVLSHNTALELATLYNAKSVVIDLDIPFGTAALNFNLQPRQTIADALAQAGRVDKELLDQFFASYEESVSLLASPASLSSGIQFTQETLDNLLGSVRPMGDFLILDLPHIWTPWINDALAAADELIIVARPDLTNLRNTKNMVEYIGPKRGLDAPVRLVLNQMGVPKRGDLAEKDFKDAVALSPTAIIPYDVDAFGRALNAGEMLSVASPKGKATLAIRELAQVISGRQNLADKE
ncbi:MAG: AAA family ATPase, partial [Rhodospirillales bacterium]|nr:AAA family ATPase [Rhodospirillales bacterium]